MGVSPRKSSVSFQSPEGTECRVNLRFLSSLRGLFQTIISNHGLARLRPRLQHAVTSGLNKCHGLSPKRLKYSNLGFRQNGSTGTVVLSKLLIDQQKRLPEAWVFGDRKLGPNRQCLPAEFTVNYRKVKSELAMLVRIPAV